MPILNLTQPIDDFPQVQIQIDYNLGGMNYFNYKEEKRGYYLRFSPCKHKDLGNGMYSTEMQPMHERSFKMCIKECKRKDNRLLYYYQTKLEHDIENVLKEYEKSNLNAYNYAKFLFNVEC